MLCIRLAATPAEISPPSLETWGNRVSESSWTPVVPFFATSRAPRRIIISPHGVELQGPKAPGLKDKGEKGDAAARTPIDGVCSLSVHIQRACCQQR